MGFFNFSKSKATKAVLPWEQVTSVEQINEILRNVGETPVLLFKHSTRCSISSMALNGFERNWNNEVDCKLYFIDLLKHRDVSNEIATLTGVIHQSPQCIVVKGSEIVYDATHTAIDAKRIESILKKS
ncbi:MAG TPA: bacillithiol system redox-active protein YtxJ [Crocinitomicaceae bacterium]|nr:bacillithiol system redox-active protein YtxJ [Crocinitomicaceae bacterium]